VSTPWLATNVAAHLTQDHRHRYERWQIAQALIAFMGEKPEIWAYYADYDWVALCQLFGTMMDLPKGWPMYCRDVKQLCDSLGNPTLPEQTSTWHHALADAEHKKGKRVVFVFPIDKWVHLLLEAGAEVRNLKDVKWCATEDGQPGKGTGRHIAMFILEPPVPGA
jgi:hypothetical protein